MAWEAVMGPVWTQQCPHWTESLDKVSEGKQDVTWALIQTSFALKMPSFQSSSYQSHFKLSALIQLWSIQPQAHWSSFSSQFSLQNFPTTPLPLANCTPLFPFIHHFTPDRGPSQLHFFSLSLCFSNCLSSASKGTWTSLYSPMILQKRL